jgi:hypothetical protein
MYEVNGRQYLVVSASSSIASGRRPAAGGPPTADPNADPKRGYVVFALPEKPKASK